MHQIDMQPLHRQRANNIKVLADAVEIGGQQQLHVALQRLVSGPERFAPRLRQLQRQRRLVNLHPLDVAFFQLGQHLLVNRQNIIQQRQAVERLAFNFAQPDIGHRAEQHRLHLVAQRQRFVHFVQQLGPGEFKCLAFCELRHDVVIVGVKPFGHLGGGGRFAGRRPTARNAKQRIEVDGVVLILMARRNVAQHQAGGQHMIVPGEVAHRQQIHARLFLLLPVAGAQFASGGQQLLLSRFARPVALLRLFQFATQADAGKAEAVVQNGHMLFSR